MRFDFHATRSLLLTKKIEERKRIEIDQLLLTFRLASSHCPQLIKIILRLLQLYLSPCCLIFLIGRNEQLEPIAEPNCRTLSTKAVVTFSTTTMQKTALISFPRRRAISTFSWYRYRN